MLRLSVLSACLACSLAMTIISTQLNQDWEQWKNFHGKKYAETEETNRRKIWEDNIQKIQEHNLQHSMNKKSYTLAMNSFGDLTNEEFKSMVNGLKFDYNKKRNGSTFLRLPEEISVNVPDTVDWREKGYVTPIKNQGQCGSCWAFSTTGSLEGQMFRKTGTLPDLSEQQLVDCSKDYGNNGCEGGLMDDAFKYIKANGGIDAETCYPYEAVDDNCRYQTTCNTGEDTGFVDVTSEDEEALKEAVGTNGPVSVAIDAALSSFQFYQSGVYNEPDCSQTQLDHGVLVVGYDSDPTGGDYWIVKNSWGTTWGQEGYIWMSRNNGNQCGIATSASYPLV